ncbi:hypothetical protein C9J21_21190 [Photobacterium phosphoreum]|uniref:VUT family protein n=1 Tax=Photobacterium phosphoreum TaxID=659 RepID=UPI000D1767BA|nr:VUT family protein [Photobacterium phosphoreum]PSW27623.1 hypothetical protein C9J21_21190 [Photobacterium phosphoreum]
MFDKLFGASIDDHGKIFYPVLFVVILISTTFFFFDYIVINIMGEYVNFPLGLILFPMTFSITNIMQYNYGKLFANTVVRYGFLGDLLLVSISYILSVIGNRNDYLSVYKEIPSIMILTFVFVFISNSINIFIFEKTKGSGFFKFFIAAFLSEMSISLISIPLMYYVNGINNNLLLSIVTVVVYKLLFSLVLSILISIQIRRNNRRQVQYFDLS